MGRNTLIIPYKIDMGSEGNIMPLFMFKKLLKITEEQLWKFRKGHIRLQTYNKTNITQLGTCVVVIKFKNIKKRCVFFVVPGNGQALLRMPDTAVLKLININIDSIQAGVAECKTNIVQEMHAVEKGCTNTDADSKIKQSTNGQTKQGNANKKTNYFLSSPNAEVDKRKSIKLTWEIHNTFGDVLMA